MKNSEKFGQAQLQSAMSRSSYQVPTEIVELPSRGKLYSDGHPLQGEERVEIKFMTTREEDLMVSPSLTNFGLALDRVLESLIISHKVDGSTLIPGDKNAILLAARKSAYGSEYEFKSVCESCLTLNEIKSSLENINIKEIKETETEYFSDHGTIFVRLPNSQALVELKILTSDDEKIIEETTRRRTKNNLPAEELLTRYRRMILSVNDSSDSQIVNEFINSMGIADSRVLKKKFLEMVPDVEFKYSHNCNNCGHVMEGGVPIGADFFWPKL